MSLKSLENRLQQLSNFFYARLVAPCCLPAPGDVDDERIKINLLRIVLGAIVLWRTALITYSSYYYYGRDGFLSCPPEFWLSLVCLALTVCLTVGFLTPLVVLALLLVYNQMDVFLSTMTLGTNLLTLCLFFFLFTNAGSRFSLDAANLRNPESPLHSLTRALYTPIGFPSKEQIRLYCWLLFMAYALTSLGAVSLHVHDEFWRKGETVALMLQNSFLCSLWQAGRTVAVQCPWLISTFSVGACLGQVIFQLFMIPLVYTRRGTWFVGLWGTAFALISFVLLQISYIPSTEAVLWALIFCPARFFSATASRAGLGPTVSGWQLRAQSRGITAGVTATSLVAFLLVIVVALGHHDHSARLLRQAAKHLGPSLYYLGLDVPDVFNRLDLSTAKCWYVMACRDATGRIRRVPIALEDGSRGHYHWFDTLYFSNLLPWRRMMGLHEGDLRELLARGKPAYAMIARIVEFDRRVHGSSERSEYLVTVYAGDLSGLKSASVVTTLSFPGQPRLVQSGRARSPQGANRRS